MDNLIHAFSARHGYLPRGKIRVWSVYEDAGVGMQYEELPIDTIKIALKNTQRRDLDYRLVFDMIEPMTGFIRDRKTGTWC